MKQITTRPLVLLFLIVSASACSRPPATQDEEAPIVLIERDQGEASDLDAMMSPEDQAGSFDMARDMSRERDLSTPPDMVAEMPPEPHPLAASDVCDELGLPRAPFRGDGAEAVIGGVAPDFGVETMRGEWTLSEHWTGCDSFVFVNHYAGAHADQIWSGSTSSLLANAPKNTHFFFGEYESSSSPFAPGAGKPSEMREKLDTSLMRMPPVDREHWRNRVHVIRDPLLSADHAIGEVLRSRSPEVLFALGIDREQRFDVGGSLASVGNQGFVGDVAMAAYIPHYYDFRAKLDASLDAQADVTVVSLFEEQEISQNDQIYPVTFPDAQAMASFNTMEIDISAACGPTPTDCGEWDYEAYMQVCQDEACETRHEIALWITPYARPGERRWVADATPFLPLFQTGGEHRVRFGMRWNMNRNLMNVSFRLRDVASAPRPVAITPLFTARGGGDNFDASYAARFPDTSFTPPASTRRVELAMLLTGHGQVAGSNCAEWCNHVHTFSVGDRTYIKEHSATASVPNHCAREAASGVVPGQYGNWAPGRAAWCPGQIVQPWRQDLTDAVTLGQENTISYTATYADRPPPGGRIRMSSYLVYYE